MIWQNMSAVGNSANPTERVEHTTAMGTIMRVTLSVEWEVGSVSLCSTKISNTRVNGETQFFKDLENCTVTENFSLRVGFKTGWSTEAGNTNTKMEIISKEFTSKTKNEATVVITLPKAAFLSHSSTPFLPKSPKSLFPTGLFIWASKETAVARALAKPHTSTAVLMTGNGKKIKNMEWDNSST